MFFKSVLSSLLISSTLLSSSLKAKPGDEFEVPGERGLVRKIGKMPDRVSEILFATKLYEIWTGDLVSNFDQLLVFLDSKAFKYKLWKNRDMRFAVNGVSLSHDVKHDATGDLLVSQPQKPLWILLNAYFEGNLPTLQKKLAQVSDDVVHKCLLPSYEELNKEEKERLLQRATRSKDADPTPGKLARNLNSLYQGEFNRNMDRFCAFIESEDFLAYLRQNEPYKNAFNEIAIEHSILQEARGDLVVHDTRPERPLYAYLFRKFGGENLALLQAALLSTVIKCSE